MVIPAYEPESLEMLKQVQDDNKKCCASFVEMLKRVECDNFITYSSLISA